MASDASTAGLSPTETVALRRKLQQLRKSLVKDEEKHNAELAEKQRVIDEVFAKLKEIRKEILVSGAELTDASFRQSMRKYLLEIRSEVLHLRTNQSSRTLKKTRINVVLTGAAGQIGYSMIPLIANGQVFGLDQPLCVRLLEIEPALKALEGVVMEIEDGSYPLVESIVATADPNVAFDNADYAILVGGFPRKKGMLRKDLLARNASIFRGMGVALEKNANINCKVLVVANPANTNCLICATNAPKIPKQNFSALTRLDYNRARSQLASKLGVLTRDVRNVIIWGNHSATQVPDVTDLKVKGKSVSASELPNVWVREEFTRTVQSRGKAIIDARGFSSAMSAANASKDAMRDWVNGTPEDGSHVAMAVWSNGNPYGIADGLFYSFPVTCKDGNYTIIPDITIDSQVLELMRASEKELLEERSEAGL